MYRLVLCVLLGLATFKLALAEPESQEEYKVPVTELPLMIQCVPSEVVDRMIEEYNELPFVEGNGNWEIPGGKNMQGRTEMYVNPKTGTFTYIIVLSDVIKCVVISGNELKPFLSEENAI